MPKKHEPLDIFLWANQADAHKDELTIDLFLFTKGYTVYTADYSNEVKTQLKVLFLYDMISQVQTGAATGMAVKPFETADGDANTLCFTELEQVEHGQEVIEQIAYGEESLEVFHEGEHELKKIKGIVARFTKKGSEPFYIVKHLPQSQILKGNVSWAFTDAGKFQSMPFAATVRVRPGNETLVADNRVFVFNEPKFIKQFGYDATTDAIIRNKVAEIESKFKLKYPEGVTFLDLVAGNATLRGKLLKTDPSAIAQDKLIEQSDVFDIALMTDDATGEIILLDSKDAIKFINLLNDDYVESGMTGIHYLATKKKQVNPTEESQTNMGI